MKNKHNNISLSFLSFLFFFSLFFIMNSHLQVHAATPVSKNGRLSINGTKVVNQYGKPFIMKGVSTHGISWFPEYINKNSFKTLRDDWHVNTIRLAMYTEEYNGYCSGNRNNRKVLIDRINKGVSYATELGMYVIIDWHILSDGNPKKHQKASEDFFSLMAKKYQSHNNVIFEICNEPNGNGGNWNNIYSYSTKIIKAIRSNNNNSIVIVGTPTWSQDVDIAAGKPLKEKNVAYALHFYANTHKTSLRSKLTTAINKGLPVIVSEYGLSSASGNGMINKKQGQAWFSILNKYQIGRIAWNLSNKNESSSLIRSSCKKTSGWKKKHLSNQGKWIRKQYRK